MIGERLLNYQIQTKLGEGGMGSVYLAYHTHLDRKAAIKALHANYVNNPQIRQRFKNEASTLAHLKHPNIVSLYDYLETPQGLFLIMEYIHGKPLDNYIDEISGPIPEDKAASLLAKALEAFEYAHSQGVIHRDIKPSNIMITPDENIKILDFGIAKILAEESKQLTKTGTRMGTVLYMSPEQVKGQNLDRRSDIYSLGVTLFQMLTGRSPYNAQSATEYEVYNQIVNQPLPRANTFYPTISGRMQAILDKATAKNPDERFQTCIEFKKSLFGASYISPAKSFQSTQTELGKTVMSPNALRNTAPDIPVYEEEERGGRRNSWLLTTLLITLFFTAAALVVFLNPFHISVFDKLSGKIIGVTSQDNDQELVKTQLELFYQAVDSHDFARVKPFYREDVEDYFGNRNIKLVPDVRASYQIGWKTYVEERHDIDWNSYEYSQDEEGNHVVQFDYRYYFKEVDKEWKNLGRRAEIFMDVDKKIFAIKNIGK